MMLRHGDPVNDCKRLLFGCFLDCLRAYQRIFLDLQVRGRENIPKGPKIFVTNHITTTDPYWVLPVFGEPVHIIIGPGYQSKLMGWIYDWFEQINAMPLHRATVVEKAVSYLRCGESIYTAPEGDLHDTAVLGRFFRGVGRIYRRSLSPIIPIGLYVPGQAMKEYPRMNMTVEGHVYRTIVVLRGPFYINIGKPFMPPVRSDLHEDADAQRISDACRERIVELIEEIRS